MQPSNGYLFLLLACLCAAAKTRAQGPPATREAFEERYRDRIRQEMLYGVYIPADVPESIRELYRLTSPASRDAFAAEPETEAVRRLHFSLGRWIIHNWGFYGGSRLSHYFRERLRIYHPDDMARFIMIAFHRSINDRPLEIPALIERFQIRADSADTRSTPSFPTDTSRGQ